MSCKFVVLAGLELGQELLDVLLNLGEFRDERLSVHLSCNITICRPPKSRPEAKRQERSNGNISDQEIIGCAAL